MPRVLPWDSIDGLIDLLTKERDAIDLQIEALRATASIDTQDGRVMALLCRYLIHGSATEAAQWANDIGWRLPSSNRGVATLRDWKGADIIKAIDQPPPDVPQGLVLLCRRTLRKHKDRSSGWG